LVLADGIEAVDEPLVLQALADYEQKNVDFVDAYLAAYAESKSVSVVTQNAKDFAKLGTQSRKPADA
jgi:predicted nucleic acid-binding protein